MEKTEELVEEAIGRLRQIIDNIQKDQQNYTEHEFINRVIKLATVENIQQQYELNTSIRNKLNEVLIKLNRIEQNQK